MPVIAIVVVLSGVAITPWLGGALFFAFIVTVLVLRYRDVKDIDYVTLRSNDPWWRAWDAYRRARTPYQDQNRPPE